MRIFLLLVFMVISTTARAGDFDWVRPGVDPYQGTKEQALILLSRGGFIPSNVIEKLGAAPCYQDTIRDGMRIGRMTFGKNSVIPNVVARVSKWPDAAKRAVQVCEYADRSTGRLYVLLRPDECGNWSINVFDTQGKCVLDKLLCDGSCEAFKKNQTVARNSRK